MAIANDVEALLVQFGASSARKLRFAHIDESPPSHALALAWPELDFLLPDGGLPRGVVELAAPRALGGSTSIALAAVRAAQARSQGSWCAWLDPEGTLHAPGVVAAGVDLGRMLVVRGPRSELARMAMKVVASGAFDVVVIDYDAVPRAKRESRGRDERGLFDPSGADRKRIRRSGAPREVRDGDKAHLLVRKLALAAEPSGATVLLLTNALEPRTLPWPVALRVELSRPGPRDLVVRIAKDKRGRIGLAKTIPFRSAPSSV